MSLTPSHSQPSSSCLWLADPCPSSTSGRSSSLARHVRTWTCSSSGGFAYFSLLWLSLEFFSKKPWSPTRASCLYTRVFCTILYNSCGIPDASLKRSFTLDSLKTLALPNVSPAETVSNMSRRKQGKPQHLSKREFSRKHFFFFLDSSKCI